MFPKIYKKVEGEIIYRTRLQKKKRFTFEIFQWRYIIMESDLF